MLLFKNLHVKVYINETTDGFVSC